MKRFYVDRYTATLERDDDFRVRVCKKDGSVIEDLSAKRLFPLTNRDMYISLVNSSDKEIAFVRDLEELDESSRRVIEECLNEYYMIPRIQKIISLSDKLGVVTIVAMTDRGEVTFKFYNSAKINVIRRDGKVQKLIFRDMTDGRYEISDYYALDVESKKKLFGYF